MTRDLPLLKLFTEKTTDPNRRTQLSMVIDELEREVYWETRQELLAKLKKSFDAGTIKETFDFMMNKEKPL